MGQRLFELGAHQLRCAGPGKMKKPHGIFDLLKYTESASLPCRPASLSEAEEEISDEHCDFGLRARRVYLCAADAPRRPSGDDHRPAGRGVPTIGNQIQRRTYRW